MKQAIAHSWYHDVCRWLAEYPKEQSSPRMRDQICLNAVEALLHQRTDEVRLVMAHLVQDIIPSALVLLP